MKKISEFSNTVKSITAIVVATAFVLGYHTQFVTKSEAAEQRKVDQEQVYTQFVLMRVDQKNQEIRTRVGEKARAVDDEDVKAVARLEENIATLRNEILSLCADIEEC